MSQPPPEPHISHLTVSGPEGSICKPFVFTLSLPYEYSGRFWHVILAYSIHALMALSIFLGYCNDLFYPITVTSSLGTRMLLVDP